jgi:hypothetical protein
VQNVTRLDYPLSGAYDDSVAQSSLPLTTAPRTVTVRVRTLMILAVIAAAGGLVWWALTYASGMQPLAAGAATFSPEGVPLVAHTRDTMDTGPAVYHWSRGGRIVVVLYLHNAASVPVTVTGADHSGAGWDGLFTGPAMGLPAPHDDGIVRPFHRVRIPADGERGVSFVFRANPRGCRFNSPGETSFQDAVNVHFTALGLFHDTQSIPLGDMAVDMTGPVGGRC